MAIETYIEDCKRSESTVFQTDAKVERLLHSSLGIHTEGAEFADALKKFVFYGKKELDEVNMKEELGDLLWYVAIACDALGTSFDELMETNINKLKARYPEKFSLDKAENRDLNAEREILENS